MAFRFNRQADNLLTQNKAIMWCASGLQHWNHQISWTTTLCFITLCSHNALWPTLQDHNIQFSFPRYLLNSLMQPPLLPQYSILHIICIVVHSLRNQHVCCLETQWNLHWYKEQPVHQIKQHRCLSPQISDLEGAKNGSIPSHSVS